MGESVISWNLQNFLTVVLMAAIGAVIFMAISRFLRKQSAKAAE